MAKYTGEVLAEAAAHSTSVTGVLRHLGLRISGGSHAHISRRLKVLGIDTSHFTGHAHNRGKRGPRKKPEERLVVLPTGSMRTPGHRLLACLLALGHDESCELCTVISTWNGQPLKLHVDHINGDFLDNRRENLRLLCPNCHSQTPTYANSRKAAGNQREDSQGGVGRAGRVPTDAPTI